MTDRKLILTREKSKYTYYLRECNTRDIPDSEYVISEHVRRVPNTTICDVLYKGTWKPIHEVMRDDTDTVPISKESTK